MTRLAVAAALVFSLGAWADIPPPDVSGCNGKAAGDACKRDDGTDGACAKSTCSRNDYSEGPPPKSVSYECLKCAPGAPVAKQEEKKGSSCAAVPVEGAVLAALWLRRRKR
jgi:hypothetical protein